MDIILQEFINLSYDQLNDEDKNAFSKLLDEQDLDILNWIMGKDKPANDRLANIINIIKTSRNIS